MTQETTSTRAATRVGGVLLSIAVLASVCGIATIAAGATQTQTDQPTVRVVGETVDENGTATVALTLTGAPDGLAGYSLRLSTDDDVARIEDASYPDRFGMTTEPEIGPDGQTAELEAVDLDRSIQPGATDVLLATVNVSGVSPGETRVTVEPIQFDADDGNAFEPVGQSDTVTVTSSDGGGVADASDDASNSTDEKETATDGEQTETDESADESGAGPIVPVVAAAAILLMIGRSACRRR